MQRINWMLAALIVAGLVLAGGDRMFAQDAGSALEQVAEQESVELPASVTALVEAYMGGRTDARDIRRMVGEARRDLGRVARQMDRQEFVKLNESFRYIARTAGDVRPDWWSHTHSPAETRFKASMWGKAFMARYVPSSALGVQYVWIEGNQLHVIVTWRPQYVDSDEPLEGWLAEHWGLTKGDLAEVIVWHELGHNYISLHLSARQAVYLYRQHPALATHMQEFFADLTALRHCSGRAAQLVLMFRNNELHRYDRTQAHTRGSHGIASILLVEWMSNPDDWPSINFPNKVPEKDVELEVIRYVYQNMDKFTINEYIQLKNYIDRWVVRGRNGDRVLREKGRVRLDNGLEYWLLVKDDIDWQQKRDAWVAKRLEKLIADGRGDTEPKKYEGRPDSEMYWSGIQIPWN